MEPIQLYNRSTTSGDLVLNSHAVVRLDPKGATELAWSASVSGKGVKAWDEGREPIKLPAGAAEAKVREFAAKRGDEITAAAIAVLTKRVRAGLAVSS